MCSDRLVLIGQILGPFGVQGAVKLYSWTDPRSAIAQYHPWVIRSPNGHGTTCTAQRVTQSGKSLLAWLPGITDRDQALALRDAQIWIARDRLPALPEGQFYWVDLEGLQVLTAQHQVLGTVSHLFDNGAHPILVVQGAKSYLIPFVQPEIVLSVDLKAALMIVDWEVEA